MKVKHYIFLTLAVAIATLCWLKWDVWFGNIPEPDFTLSDAPQRVFITPGEDGMSDRSFSWVSGSATPFVFNIIKDSIESKYTPTHNEIITGGGTTHLYGVRLSNLSMGEYRYYITAPESTDTLWGDFNILPDDGVLDFLLLGDIQDPWDTGSKDFFKELYSRFPDMDAWLFLGDVIERPHDQYWALFYDTVDSIAPRTAFISIPGNHEYNKGGLTSIGARWTNTFVMPLNGNKDRLGRNFFIDYPSVRIIGLDTNAIISDFIDSRKWLDNTIADNKAPFTITMGHHGVYSVRKGRMNPEMKYGINPIYKKHLVDLVLQGHDHAYSRNGGPDSEEGTRPVYVTQATSAKTYDVGNPKDHIASGSGQRFYSHIRITSDTIYFKTYQQNHTLYDSFVLPRKL